MELSREEREEFIKDHPGSFDYYLIRVYNEDGSLDHIKVFKNYDTATEVYLESELLDSDNMIGLSEQVIKYYKMVVEYYKRKADFDAHEMLMEFSLEDYYDFLTIGELSGDFLAIQFFPDEKIKYHTIERRLEGEIVVP